MNLRINIPHICLVLLDFFSNLDDILFGKVIIFASSLFHQCRSHIGQITHIDVCYLLQITVIGISFYNFTDSYQCQLKIALTDQFKVWWFFLLIQKRTNSQLYSDIMVSPVSTDCNTIFWMLSTVDNIGRKLNQITTHVLSCHPYFMFRLANLSITQALNLSQH